MVREEVGIREHERAARPRRCPAREDALPAADDRLQAPAFQKLRHDDRRPDRDAVRVPSDRLSRGEPDESRAEVLLRVADFLNAGTAAVWAVDPASETVEVFRPGKGAGRFRRGESFAAGEPFPGLEIEIDAVFDVD